MSTDDLTEEDLALVDLIAEKVTDRLHRGLFRLPPEAAAIIREQGGGRWMYAIGYGAELRIEMDFGHDGSLGLKLLNGFDGCTRYWQGVLSP